MGSISAARVMCLNQDSPIAVPRLAKIIPFGRRKPEPEMPTIMHGEEKRQDVTGRLNFIKSESAKGPKDKGVVRRSAEPPSDHWLLAWVVWVYYITVYMKAGLRVDEESRKYEFRQRTATRT